MPTKSFAPDTDTEYEPPATNAAEGVNDTVLDGESYEDTPATTPDGPVNPNTTDAGCTSSLNVALTTTPDDTPTADATGTVDTTDGGVTSVMAGWKIGSTK